MTPKCTPTLGICAGVMNVQSLGWKGKQAPNWAKKVLKRRCLKWPHIVHLYLICMSYDQKKGRESNWEFDSRP
jgi:hypothetical protein